ncbi:TonB-dependent receptor [Corticibacter populi]|uniref:TonB-dependent receptor n=2 Tax=Corticibacter populi TaxID=1550736 RepID=A0A3M6QV16_9BURK|nr:TonB-dependent receptor [Corticibacter populi]
MPLACTHPHAVPGRQSGHAPSNLTRAAVIPLILSAGLGASGATMAQNPMLDEVVVTATRTEQRLIDTLADVSVLDREAIEQSGVTGVADVLARLPGVEISRNGGPGATTSVFLRGGNTSHTAVFIDGARVDSQSTGGAPWEAMPLSMIERIEVLRGPAAAVYGSDAIGGVIQIFTRKGQAGYQPYVSVGAGNQRTWDVAGGVSGAAHGWDYAVSASHERSRGFNARPDTPTANPDDDGYRRSSAHAKLGYQFSQGQRLQGSLLSSHVNAGYDTTNRTRDDRAKNRLHTLNLAWNAQWSERYGSTLSVSDSTARYETTPNPYLTDTRIRSYLFQNEYRLGAQLLTAALERREDHLENDPIDRSRHQNALALGYGVQLGAHSLQANARYDDDSEFGGETTGSLAYGLAITPNWRARASVGKAFRAPTLYQRFSDYGVASLVPETSRNVEAGLVYSEGSSHLSITVYRNTVRNLISYVSNTGGVSACASDRGCYANTARARYQGITIAGGTELAGVRLHGSVDVQNPKDLDTNKQLARRAKRHAMLGADWNAAGWLLGAEMQTSAARWDDAANVNRLGGYTLWNLTVSRPLAKDWLLTARFDNLTDKQYELARTYATAGRTFYVGLKWAPGQ